MWERRETQRGEGQGIVDSLISTAQLTIRYFCSIADCYENPLVPFWASTFSDDGPMIFQFRSLYTLLLFTALLAALSDAGKILIYSPSLTISHLISNARIADTLVEAGHDVVWISNYKFKNTYAHFFKFWSRDLSVLDNTLTMGEIGLNFGTQCKLFELFR